MATLKKIYTQTGTTCLAAYGPLLSEFGLATREFFIDYVLGLDPGADVANFAGPDGVNPCDRDTDSAGNLLLENTGNLLTGDKQIAPYAVSSGSRRPSRGARRSRHHPARKYCGQSLAGNRHVCNRVFAVP